MISENKTTQGLTLRNGRFLAYSEYGDPIGKPVIYCHGSPGSRLDLANMEETLNQAGVRLIALDRPGIGLSDFKPGYQLLDWPDDVIELADELDLDKFGVLGLSGGGPFCAACSYKIPERLTKASLVSGIGLIDEPGATEGMGQTNKRIFSLARRANWLIRLQYALMARGLKSDPDRVLKQMKTAFPEPDRVLLEQHPEEAQSLLDSMSEALRAGTKGIAHEWSLYVRPWGFNLEDISIEVDLWHGEADTNVPVSMGQQMAQAIPNSTTHFLPNEGHVSLFVNHLEEILSELVG